MTLSKAGGLDEHAAGAARGIEDVVALQQAEEVGEAGGGGLCGVRRHDRAFRARHVAAGKG